VTAKAWDPTGLREERVFRPDMDWVTNLSLSPDGLALAVAGGSFHRPGMVQLLDLATGQERGRYETRANTVSAAVFTRDGKTLIAATAPPISPFTSPRHGGVYRWEVSTGQELPPLR